MSEAQSYRVLIADDHPLFRGALREAVNRLFDRVEVAEAGTFEQVVERLETGGEVGEMWAPPDVELAGAADAETAALIRRLATLTPQQVRVLMMLSGGLLNKQIAYELCVSEATVKAHVSAILQKLGVDSRTQAVIAAGKIETGQWPLK